MCACAYVRKHTYKIIVPTLSESRIPLSLDTTELWYLNQKLLLRSLYTS